MKIIASEQILYVDVDYTLLIWSADLQSGSPFYDPYEEKFKKVKIHYPHLEIVKDRLKRGATIILHSQSGYEWAASAARCLGLDKEEKVIVMSKPIGYIDDKPCEKWMGDHINLDINDPYGS